MTSDELKAAFAALPPMERIMTRQMDIKEAIKSIVEMPDRARITKIEADDTMIIICETGEPHLVFDHTATEILELILRRLDGIDIDLIHGIFQAMDGKYLASADWDKLIEVIRDFDPCE